MYRLKFCRLLDPQDSANWALSANNLTGSRHNRLIMPVINSAIASHCNQTVAIQQPRINFPEL